MKTKENTEITGKKRLPYSKPKLHSFGAVGALTAGTGGMMMDMGSMTQKGGMVS
ncbi:MAG: hypothetical protein AAGB19_03500 [Cyanobacteria bacterium P01_F01_bin.3]